MTGEGGGRAQGWADVLRDALLGALDADDFDVTTDQVPGVVEVSADDWTLTVEGLGEEGDVTAWLAVDDEPDDPARFRVARRAVMPAAVELALAQADAAVDGALRAALEAGGDPFSQDLAAALTNGG